MHFGNVGTFQDLFEKVQLHKPVSVVEGGQFMRCHSETVIFSLQTDNLWTSMRGFPRREEGDRSKFLGRKTNMLNCQTPPFPPCPPSNP